MGVKFISVKLKATFLALLTKDSSTLYWIEETQELYKGSKLFGTGALATQQVAGLLSPEDKAKLDSLISTSGDLSKLSAVDGTINITDTVDGGKAIGVAISKNPGNALVAVNDGLFVQKPEEVVIPEYTIEKQVSAEEGYAASYRLKRIVGDESSYVGDTINVAKDILIQSVTLEVVTETDVPYIGAIIGDPYIKMVFNDASASNIYIPVKSLMTIYSSGEGIEIIDNKISVKLANDTHGLIAVDGALAINLATKDSDGAMSKEDKRSLDAIPSIYIARKYEVSDTPKGTLVTYGEKEIRIMCPANAVFSKQSVGDGGDANSYYVTFKTYVPDDRAVGYIEHLNGQVDEEILTTFSVDEYGRRYQSTWLSTAVYDEATNTWSYYGKESSVSKYIGWDYQIDWYDADGVMIYSDSVRINLSNESCHNNIKPYFAAEYATTEAVDALRDAIADVEDNYTWGEM